MTDLAADGLAAARVRQRALVFVLTGVLQRSFGFLLLPFVTRVLTPEEYGRISVIVTTSSLVAIVLAAAVEVPLFRAVARGGPGARDVVRWSRWYLVWLLPATCTVIAGVIMGVGGWFMGGTPYLWAAELAAVGMLAALTYFALPVLRAADQLVPYFFLVVGWVVLSVATKIVFLAGVLPGAAGWVTSDLLAAATAWAGVVLVLRNVEVAEPLPGVVTSGPLTRRELLMQSMTLVPHRLSFWSLTALSRPALALVASLREVGLYAFAMNVALAAMVLLAELNRAVLLEYTRETFPAPTHQTRWIARTQVAAAISLPTGMVLVLALAADVLVGPGFVETVPLIIVLLAGQVAYGLYLVPMNYLVQTADRYTWSSAVSVGGALLVLVFILIGGVMGTLTLVAVGTALGYGAMLLGAIVLVRISRIELRWRECVPSRLLLTPLVAAYITGSAGTLVGGTAGLALLVVSSLCLVSAAVIGRSEIGLSPGPDAG